MAEKDELRKAIRLKKKGLTQAEKEQAAETVRERVEHLAEFADAERILLYHSLPDELQTGSMLKEWASKKQIFLPRVKGDDLEILPFSETDLSVGSFSILEPTGSDTADIRSIDLAIVPGVAFDSSGHRLGRGKGFYDRLLRHAQCRKIGIAYDFQLVQSIPSEPHDVGMDMIITEKNTITPQ